VSAKLAHHSPMSGRDAQHGDSDERDTEGSV
jgi:hypothetical protein